jgi:hypothetical protein
MIPKLESLLKKTTFEIRSKQNGTGFAISPRLVATAFHLVEDAANPLELLHEGRRCRVEKVITTHAQHDILLLQLAQPVELYSFLSDDVTAGDRLICCGFPSGIQSIDYWDFNGWATVNGDSCLKVKDGLAKGGLSGSPILNARTGAVCGMITTSLDTRVPVGAYGLPAALIASADPDSVSTKRESYENYRRWNATASSIASYDQSSHVTYRRLFDFDDTDFTKILVSPDYRCLRVDTTLTIQEAPSTEFIQDATQMLSESNCLFIFGGYGVGKTFLSKVLLNELYIAGDEVAFIRASDLDLACDELKQFLSARRGSAIPCTLVIDGFDECNALRKEHPDFHGQVGKQLVPLLATAHVNMRMIVNSRFLPSKADDLYINLLAILSDKLHVNTLNIIAVDYFRRPQIESWLDAYAEEQTKRGADHRPFFVDIPSRKNVNIRKACRNPLFLYMYARQYYAASIESTDLFSLYERFVDATVRGKFDHEGKRLYSKSISDIAPKYRSFLSDMATKIAITQESLHISDASYESWELDENEHRYCVPLETIESIIDAASEQLLTSEERRRIDKDRLHANILSCYFLGNSPDGWHFRDNNILFFMIADLFAADFLQASQIPPNAGASISNFFPRLANLQEIPLHPVSVRMFLLRLRKLEADGKRSLQAKLWEILKGHRQILNPRVDMRLRLLIALAFVNTYDGSYAHLGGFSGELMRISNILSSEDRVAFNILRSFFCEVEFVDLTLERLDLSDYNFSQTHFNNVHFKNCQLNEALFVGCQFDGVTFEKCEIKKANCDGIAGNIRLVMCEFDATIPDPGSLSLIFENSQVNQMHVSARRVQRGSPLTLQFHGGKVQNIILKKQFIRNLTMRHASHARMKVPGSDIRFSIDEHSICNSGSRWQRDGHTILFDIDKNEYVE